MSTTGLMASGPAALDWSSPASSFKIPASDISIWDISLGLNVPGMFSSLRAFSYDVQQNIEGQKSDATLNRLTHNRMDLLCKCWMHGLHWYGGHGEDKYRVSTGVSFSRKKITFWSKLGFTCLTSR